MAALRFFIYLLMIPTAIGMAFLGIIGFFTPYINPNIWWIPAFSGLFMPLIMIGNFFLIIYWALYKKLWIILPIIAVISNYFFFVSMFQSPWKENISCENKKTINIASYNVECFYWIVRDPVKSSFNTFISENDIDILCIQEHCEEVQIDSLLIHQRIALPNRAIFFNRSTEWANFGISVYSRFPILRQGNIDFHSDKNSSMWVDLLVEGDTIRVFNNHLQTTDVNINRRKFDEYKSIKNWGGQARTLVLILEQLKTNFEIRAQQAALVRQLIDATPYPTIICGDFNDTPISYTYNHISGHEFQDGFRDCGKGYGHSFNGLKGLLRIDFIAYNSVFCGELYDSPTLPWSDHNPILMKLRIEK